MKRKMAAGSTSQSIPIFLYDSTKTDGSGLGSLAYNSSGLVAEYRRQGQSSWTAITLAAGTLGTWSSGGFVADGSIAGAYELGLPDAALAASVAWVVVQVRGATNQVAYRVEIELDAVNYQSATGFVASVPAVVGAVGSVTSAVTLPSIPANWITAAGINAAALNGKGDWLVASGYPAHFGSLAIDTSGRVDLGYRVGRDLSLPDGTLAGATSSTITLPATDAFSNALATDGRYVGKAVVLSKNTGVGQQATLTAWSGSGVAGGLQYTVSPSWVVTPDNTSQFLWIPSGGGVGGGSDPWATSLPGSYSSGQAGYIVGHNLDAAVSSLSTYAGGDTAGTTTLLARLTSTRAVYLDQLNPAGYDALLAAVTGTPTYTVTLPTNGTDGNPLNSTGGYANTDWYVRVGTGAGGLLRVLAWVSGLVYQYDPARSATVDATSGVTFGPSNAPNATASLGSTAPAGWINAAAIAANALAGKGDWLAKSTALSTSPTAGTAEHALTAALGAAVGKVTQSGTTFVLYCYDNSTPLRTFTVNSSTSPTTRT